MASIHDFPFVSKLQGGVHRKDANQWEACCPAHHDTVTSLCLSISEKEGQTPKLLIHCQAGCSKVDVIQAAGFNGLSCLYPEVAEPRSKKPAKERVCHYDYTDEMGLPVYRAVRYRLADGSKDFRQCRPKTDGTWDDGETFRTSGIHKKYPYRLTGIVSNTKPVFVVEGEKDADRLADLGLVSTCNIGGAGKWDASCSEWLAGRKVIIIADNDEPGRVHAADVAEKTLPHAEAVWVIELPNLTEKQDTSDWLDQGNGVSELVAILKGTEPYQQGSRPQITDGQPIRNCRIVQNGESLERVPKSLSDLFAETHERCGGWPKRIGEALFEVHDGRVRMIKNHHQFVNVLSDRSGRNPEFHAAVGAVSERKLFEKFATSAENYEWVEEHPHFPERPDTYYTCTQPKPGNGSAIEALLDFFNPKSKEDRALIKAMIVTLWWGGPPGARPLFVITTNDGPGAGKTKLAEAVCSLVGGGLMPVSNNMNEVSKMIINDGSAARAVIIDNVKSNRLSSQGFESMTTARRITGDMKYGPTLSRPNTMTWVMTVNGASVSKDLATRSVIICLKRPDQSPDWERRLAEFIREHKDNVAGDARALIEAPAGEYSGEFRFGEWESEVLSKCGATSRLAHVNNQRQDEANVEVLESQLVADHLRSLLVACDLEHEPVFVEAARMYEWLKPLKLAWATSVVNCSRTITRLCRGGTGDMNYLMNHRFNVGRGFVIRLNADWEKPGEVVRLDSVLSAGNAAEIAVARILYPRRISA